MLSKGGDDVSQRNIFFSTLTEVIITVYNGLRERTVIPRYFSSWTIKVTLGCFLNSINYY